MMMREFIRIVEAALMENNSFPLLKLARRVFGKRADVYWHQTGVTAAKSIAETGFKTGRELSKGEACDAIFFTKDFHREVSYGRGEQKTMYLPVVTTGLSIIDNFTFAKTLELKPDGQEMVDAGVWTVENAKQYQISRMMDNAEFPPGIDGIEMLSEKGHTRRLALTKDAANKGLQEALRQLQAAKEMGP